MIKKILSHKFFLNVLKESTLGYKWSIVYLLSLILIVTFINISLPYFFGTITELILKDKFELKLFIIIISIYVLKLILQYFVSYKTNDLSGNISVNLKTILIEKYIDSKVIHTDFIKSGDFHQRIFNETGLLQGKIIFGTIFFFKDIIFFFLLLVNIFIISPLLFFDMLIFSALLYLFHNKIGNKVEIINNHRQIENANLSSFFLEILNGKNDIIIFNLLEKVIESVNILANRIKKYIKLNAFYQGLSDVFLEILIMLFVISIVFILMIQKMELNYIITTIGYILLLLWPMKSINTYLMSLNTVLPSINRIEMVLLKMNSKNEDIRKISINNQIYLSLKNISFSYNDNNIFNKTDFSFKEGAYLVSGENGVGKSTLAKLILGIEVPTQGNIEIVVRDRNNALGLVSQSPFLYNKTIKENLKINKNITNNYIENIIMEYKLNETFNLDLNKLAGENGKNLSGGEKQIISILRGIIKNPNILILDEITNNLPLKVYENIITRLLSNRKNLITIIITHHKIDSILFDEKIKINAI